MQWPDDFVPSFSPERPNDEGSTNFAFMGEDLLLCPENRNPPASQLALLGEPRAAFVFGHIAGKAISVAAWHGDAATPSSLQRISLRQAFGLLPAGHWSLAARAKQMLGWDLATRFCGACGSATQALTGEPAKLCPACGQRSYPQIAPAIMCLVRRGNELLLARSPHFRAGMYSALAGFVEAGESVEACVQREVFEETGIRVKNLRWFASQPWPFPQSLMLAFHADYAGGEIAPQPGEIEDAQWFSLAQLPDLPAPVSIAARLIADAIADMTEVAPHFDR